MIEGRLKALRIVPRYFGDIVYMTSCLRKKIDQAWFTARSVECASTAESGWLEHYSSA